MLSDLLTRRSTRSRPAAVLLIAAGPAILAAGRDPSAGGSSTGSVARQVRRQGQSDGPGLSLSLPGGVQLEMVWIPGGTFLMGSPDDERGRESQEGPQHQVTLTRGLFVGRYEVTQAQWEAVVGSNPASGDGIGPDFPVNEVSFQDIAGYDGFLDRLNQHLEATGQGGAWPVRLPSEAEWEYAARAGTLTRFSFGDAMECDDGCAECQLAAAFAVWCGSGAGHADRVGERLANPWGLHDMHGNLWEWTSTWSGTYPSEPQVDPQGPESGEYMIFRGGSAYNGLDNARSAARGGWHHTSCRARNIGFRVVMTAPGQEVEPAHWAIPAVARVQGSGAFFTSRVELFNAGSEVASVEVRYTPRDDVGGPSLDHEVALPAGALVEIEDPLGAWFGFGDQDAAVGSLLVTAGSGETASVALQSTVSAVLSDGSEFGQFFPAQRVDAGVPAGASVLLATTEDPGHNRVNCGVMALADDTEIAIRPVDPIGVGLAPPRVVRLDRGGSSQINDVHAQLGLAARADFLLQVEVVRGSATAYVSVLDGVGAGSGYPGTSDPTTILPTGPGSGEVTLLVMGSIVGYDEFRGSGRITNHSSVSTDVEARFHALGVAGAAETSWLQLGPGVTVGFIDMVHELFGIDSGVGTVVFDAAGEGRISASGREYSLLRGAAGEVVGTAGQLMPGLTEADLVLPGTVHHLLGLKHRQWETGLERSHLAAFNPGGATVQVTVAMLDATSGAGEGVVSFAVEPLELVQQTNILQRVNPAQDGELKRLEVTVDGPVHLLAFRVNRNGDPVTIPPADLAHSRR